VPKWLEIDQDNLRMKFSALNVDFSGLGSNLLHSARPTVTHLAVHDYE